MTPGELVDLLDTVPELRLDAVALLGELDRLERAGQLTGEAMTAMSPRIAKALKQLGGYVDEVRRVVDRCKQLPAIPTQSTPLGF